MLRHRFVTLVRPLALELDGDIDDAALPQFRRNLDLPDLAELADIVDIALIIPFQCFSVTVIYVRMMPRDAT